MKKAELTFKGDLETIRKELMRSNKTNQDLEVTSSELKEEVCTECFKGEGLSWYDSFAL